MCPVSHFTDIDSSASTIDGATLVGKTVYTTDTDNWYIIKNDLALEPFYIPPMGEVNITGGYINGVKFGTATDYSEFEAERIL